VHTRSAAGKTFIGFLLGDLYQCPESGVKYVLIDQGLRVGAEVPGDQTSALLAKVWPRLQEQIPGQKRRLIGWYHNHPASASEFTRGDIGTHMMYFMQPWQVGLVMGTEDSRPAAGWFRMSQDENWATIRHPFYEVLAADSIDSTGKKRSHVDWANFKPYRAVPPPARKPAAPRVSTVAPQPAPPPPAPRPSVQRAPPRIEEPEEPPEDVSPPPPVEEAPVEEAPVEDEAPVEEEPVPEPPRRASRFARPAPPPAFEEEEPPARAPARRSVQFRARPAVPAVEPRAERPAPMGVAAWKPWAMGGAGAGAMVLLILAGWGLGLVRFGRVAQSAPGQEASPQPAAPPPAQPSAQVNPALVALDQLTDSVLGAVLVYGDRRASFRGPEGCAALAEALVAVEGHWMAYNARGKPRDLVLDDRRAARDQSLYARVDTVETHFDQTACPRP
jgi:hypothetical protein